MISVASDYSIALTTLKSFGLLGRPSVYYLQYLCTYVHMYARSGYQLH